MNPTRQNAALAARLVLAVAWSLSLPHLGVASPPIASDALPAEALEPLAPVHVRTEAEGDRLLAAALYATGRTLDQNDQGAEALRCFQRAYRLDPASATILDEIVRLASRLDREEEAVRYAVLMLELGVGDVELGRHLTSVLSERGEYARAARLFDRLLPLAVAEEKERLPLVLLHLQAGRVYFLSNQYGKAADALKLVDQALREPARFEITAEQAGILRGEKGLTYQLLGVTYLEAGRLDEAVEAFRRLYQVKSDSALLGYHLARIEARRNNPISALEYLGQYFAAQSVDEGETPYELWIDLLGKLNRGDEVATELTKLFDKDQRNESLALVIARQSLAAKHPAEAAAILERAEKAVIAAGDSPSIDLYERRIEAHLGTGQEEPLLAVLRKIVHRANTLQGLEERLRPLGKEPALLDRFFALVEKRAAESPERDRAERAEEAFAAAHVALWTDREALAAKLFERAEQGPAERIGKWRLAGGAALLMAEKYAAAAEVFRRGAEDSAENERRVIFDFYLAGCLEMSGRTDEALVVAKRAAQGKPDSAEHAARVAWIEYHAQRYDDALRSYRQMLDRFGSNYDAENREVVRNAKQAMSSIHATRGDFAAAEELLEQVLDEFPEDIGAANDLGYLWVDQNRHVERGFRLISRAVAAEPDNKAYLDSLGWAHFRLGRFAEAVQALEKAATADDVDGVVLDHLGEARAKSGDSAGARAAWQRAIEAHEKAGDKPKAQAIQLKQNALPKLKTEN